MPSTPPATTPESVCSKPAVPLGQPVFFCPRGALCFPPDGPQSVEKSARCGFLHTRLSSSPCQPAALGSAGPACPTRLLPAHRRKEAQRRANRPIGKSPALTLECRGFFCFALIEAIPERHFHFPHQLPQKEENSTLCELLPGAGGLLTSPLVSGVPHRANCPHLKIPGTRSGMPGSFYLFTAAVPGVTSARRSHGLPL